MRIVEITKYIPYARNPAAAQKLASMGQKMLSAISWTEVLVGRSSGPDREVLPGGNVIQTLVWVNEAGRLAFRRDTNFRLWLEFMLHGWVLKGSTAADPAAELVDYILSGNSGRERARDPGVPDNMVVWDGQEVVLYRVD